MKAFCLTADWRPRKGYDPGEREICDKRAFRANMIYKNPAAAITDVPLPEVGPGDVLLAVGACGVCGTDLKALASDEEGYSAYSGHLRLPVVMGHEFSGEVVEVGRDVKTVRKGDLIAAEQVRWCGKCGVCRTGLFNQCVNMEETGLSCDGAFAEYAVVPEKYCCIINDLADRLGGKLAALEAGALAEPTCVAYSGMVVNAGGFKPGSNFAVFGAGPIGLASIALAKAFGAAKIIAFNTNPARTRIAQKMGADLVLDPYALAAQGTTAGELILQETGGIGAGMIVEASGNFRKVYQDIIKGLAGGGHVVQLGMGTESAVIDMTPLIVKSCHIHGSLGHAGSGIFPSVLRMMSLGRINMLDMVSGRCALAQTWEAIEIFGRKELGHAKILVSPHYPHCDT